MGYKLSSVGYFSADAAERMEEKQDLYNAEKRVIAEDFRTAISGKILNWEDKSVKSILSAFAKKVIETVVDGVDTMDTTSLLLPVETIDPGDTYVFRELYGSQVYFGTYGAAVRMSRPNMKEYTATTQLKEIGLRLVLTQMQTGKYSPSEMGEFTSRLITAFRNRLLLTTTLGGMTEYQSGGDYYEAGTSIGLGTMINAFDNLSEESDIDFIVGRRYALQKLTSNSGYSSETRREFETKGQMGSFMGAPMIKLNTFTDPFYGTVYPMPKNRLWLFTKARAGVYVRTSTIRTSEEIVPASEVMNIYNRWDDGYGIFKTNRIGCIDAIT